MITIIQKSCYIIISLITITVFALTLYILIDVSSYAQQINKYETDKYNYRHNTSLIYKLIVYGTNINNMIIPDTIIISDTFKNTIILYESLFNKNGVKNVCFQRSNDTSSYFYDYLWDKIAPNNEEVIIDVNLVNYKDSVIISFITLVLMFVLFWSYILTRINI